MTDKLARASIKAVEYWPNYLKCCVAKVRSGMENAKLLGKVFIVNLSAPANYKRTECTFCHAPSPKFEARIIAEGRWAGYATSLDWLDIDEGIYSPERREQG